MTINNGGPAIRVRDLRKNFGEQSVLSGISLTVARRDALVVLGRSGVGKSVLLKLIIGLHKPDSGSIEVQGNEITSLDLIKLNEIRKKMGFLFQSAALFDSLTVAENVAFPLRRHTQMADAERTDRVEELLSRVGMQEARNKQPAEISGGMKKRVGLARALALDPEIMLYDEPTAELDPITSGEINELIRGLREERGISSVVVTHDLNSARAVGDHVAFLNEGTVVMEGTIEDMEKSDDAFVSAFVKQCF